MPILVLVAREFTLAPQCEERWLQDLPAQRQSELRRWPDAAARHRSLIATRVLLAGLRRFGIDGAPLERLRHAPGARPALDLPPGADLDFSLSHCEGRVLCALSRGGPVGIDVEPVASLVAGEFPNYLSAAERAWAGADPARFASLWTRKEAVAKAAGAGGLADVPRVATDAAGDTATLDGTTWRTVEIPAGVGFFAHLACGIGRELPQCVAVERIPREALAEGGPVPLPSPSKNRSNASDPT